MEGVVSRVAWESRGPGQEVGRISYGVSTIGVCRYSDH